MTDGQENRPSAGTVDQVQPGETDGRMGLAGYPDPSGHTGIPASAQGPVLEVEHLVKQYPGAAEPVLNDVSFRIPKGKVFVVLGPSGSGKSTLLRTIAGLEPIQGGRILLDGETVEAGRPGKGGKAPGGEPDPGIPERRSSYQDWHGLPEL